MKRKVTQLIAPRKFEIVEEKVQPIKSNEMLVNVVSIGLCHSEIPEYLGKSRFAVNSRGEYSNDKDMRYPIQLVHEPLGIIEEIGSDLEYNDFKVGDCVTGLIKPSFASYVTVR